MPKSLETRFLARDERALARGISLLEAGSAAGQQLLQAVRSRAGQAHIVGITGSPGSGKSTLTDGLIATARERGRRVAVLAVDPSSPYSGGAILGDRIRMLRHHQDEAVYIRSMATRGHLGGLAASTLQVTTLLDAFGFDLILVETVGVGQSEVDIVHLADTTVLVLTPGQGDGVQAFKAGIMEIADIFVINKFDHPGGERLRREIKATLELSAEMPDWVPPIQKAIASQGEGIAELSEALQTHREHLRAAQKLIPLRRQRVRIEVSALLSARLHAVLEALPSERLEAVLTGEVSAASLVDTLVSELAVGA